jgi:N-acetylneuraminic acid mutarotase
MFPLFLAVVLLSGTIAGLAQTQTAEPASTGTALDVVEPPPELIVSAISVDELEALADAPLDVDAGPASDTCAGATDLDLSLSSTNDGSATLVNSFTEEPSDPNLWCTWGDAPRPQGYRSAWFRLVARDTGQVTVTTRGTDYDTILGVYSGACENLLQLACSDDYLSLQSEVTFQVVRNRTYFIEVVDYQRDLIGPTLLEFGAFMDVLPSKWEQIGNMPYGGVSRHALAVYDRYIYILGGQERIQNIPTLTNRVLRFDAFDLRWAEMANIPGAGLSNTTAVQLGGRIYVPGGFDGNTTAYSGTHWSYNIAADAWKPVASIPTNLLPDGRTFAWSAAAAEPGGASYYLTGGLTTQIALDPAADVISNTYRYTPSSNQWQAAPAMTRPRYGHTAVWLEQGNKGFCVAGGLSIGEFEGEPITILLGGGECLNPATGVWTEIASLNFPRYNAGSAIGPDGSWYIFGGMDATGAVAETEVYDATDNVWRLLDSSYSLGRPLKVGSPNNDPPRTWPRGTFIGDNMWVFGGNNYPERRTISSYKILRPGHSAGAQPAHQVMLPLTSVEGETNFLDYALPVGEGGTATGNFWQSNQFYNSYYFDWPYFGRATILLRDIPSDSNFNVWLYDARKLFLGRGDPATYGGQKSVSRTLEPGRYYILVQRIFPKDLPDPNDYYSVSVIREPGR